MSYRIFIASVVVFACIVIVLWQKPDVTRDPVDGNPQLAQSISPTATPLPSSTPTLTQRPTDIPVNTATPTSPPINEIGTSSDIIYPGAKLVSDDGQTTVYTTQSDASQVGEWYKNRIGGEYNVTNYIDVTANDVTSITLQANNSQTNQTLKIEIEQSFDQSTTILVTQN